MCYCFYNVMVFLFPLVATDNLLQGAQILDIRTNANVARSLHMGKNVIEI